MALIPFYANAQLSRVISSPIASHKRHSVRGGELAVEPATGCGYTRSEVRMLYRDVSFFLSERHKKIR